MKRLLSLILLTLIVVGAFATYLNTEAVIEKYKSMVEDYNSQNSKIPFVNYVKEQFNNLSLYRFYKIKMVGSVDKRETALDLPYFLMALIRTEESIQSENESFRIGSLCESEGEIDLGFMLIIDEEEEKNKKIKEEKECLEKVMEAFASKPLEIKRKTMDFNEFFAKALFLSYVEARLKNTNVTQSLVKNSAALTHAFKLYNSYTKDDLNMAFTHVLGYYLGVIHEPLLFEIKGLNKRLCSGCKYVKVYSGEDKLGDFIETYNRDNILDFQSVIKTAVEFLKDQPFKDQKDFEWKIRLASQYIYEYYVENNIRKMEWSDLKENAEIMIEHTIAYYLGGTDLEPPIKLDIPQYKVLCGNGSCIYRFYRYKAPDEIAGILSREDIVKEMNEILDKLSQNNKNPEEFSKILEQEGDQLKQKAMDEIAGLKDKFAMEIVKVTPRHYNVWWLRYLIYVVLAFAALRIPSLRDLLIFLMVAFESFYIMFLADFNSMGEELIYSLAIFFTFLFIILLYTVNIKRKWLYVVLGALAFILLFVPTYVSSEHLLMKNHPDFHKSPYYDLLRNDLYDGAKFEEKGKLSEEELESRFGRNFSKALSSKKGTESFAFKSALKLADKIVKYSDEDLRKDFWDFLEKRLKGRETMLNEFKKIFDKYRGNYYSPSVLTLQAYSSAKLSLIFMLVFIVSYFIKSSWKKLYGILGIIFSIVGFFVEHKIFVEYAIPDIILKGHFVSLPWIQILLLIYSLILIFTKSEKGRVRK
ncbi:MAG: NADH-quinone oxidoreductase subunit J [Thermotogaceae bacterium]|nr:NADH-quinone oxidoreductase subunit J [Thermotogaceae bacterium]